MAKIVSLLMVLAMTAQLIRPLGLPGLTRRADFWKIGLFAIGALVLVVALREAADALG